MNDLALTAGGLLMAVVLIIARSPAHLGTSTAFKLNRANLMVILIVLVILWTPYLVAGLLRAQHAGAPTPARPQQACAAPPSVAQSDAGSQNGPAWSALDDRQLTRLLTDSAPLAITE